MCCFILLRECVCSIKQEKSQKKNSSIEDAGETFLDSSHQNLFYELKQTMHDQSKKENNPIIKLITSNLTLSRNEFTTRERETWEPTATRDFMIVSIISTCLFTSGGRVSPATHHYHIQHPTHNTCFSS